MKVIAAIPNAAPSRKDAGTLVIERLPAPAAAVNRWQAPPVHLTPRQVEVLSLLCEGLPNKLICRQLNIATGTVKAHIGVILRELGVTSRLQAVVAAQRCGLLDGTGRPLPPTVATPSDAPPAPVSNTRFGAARGLVAAG